MKRFMENINKNKDLFSNIESLEDCIDVINSLINEKNQNMLSIRFQHLLEISLKDIIYIYKKKEYFFKQNYPTIENLFSKIFSLIDYLDENIDNKKIIPDQIKESENSLLKESENSLLKLFKLLKEIYKAKDWDINDQKRPLCLEPVETKFFNCTSYLEKIKDSKYLNENEQLKKKMIYFFLEKPIFSEYYNFKCDFIELLLIMYQLIKLLLENKIEYNISTVKGLKVLNNINETLEKLHTKKIFEDESFKFEDKYSNHDNKLKNLYNEKPSIISNNDIQYESGYPNINKVLVNSLKNEYSNKKIIFEEIYESNQTSETD